MGNDDVDDDGYLFNVVILVQRSNTVGLYDT